MKPANLLILMSDEHNPKVMGCAGHAIVQTLHLDRLAARGTIQAESDKYARVIKASGAKGTD